MDGRTRVSVYLSRPAGEPGEELRQLIQGSIDASYTGLGPFIEKCIAEGRVTVAR